MQLSPQWRYKLNRWKETLSNLFSGGQREDARPKICPACGTLVGTTATRCHECGTSLSFSMAAMGKSFSSFLPEESPVTYSLLGLCFMLFTVSLIASAQKGSFSLFGSLNVEVLYRLGGRYTPSILFGFEWWRLVLPMFLHGNIIHIGFNMLWLKDLGPLLEEVYGSPRFLFLYVMTGICGFIWTTLWDIFVSGNSGVGIGASGAIMGLIGLALAITTRRGGAYIQMIRGQLIRSVLFVLVFGLVIPYIDNAAHIGGFVSGFLLGKVFSDRPPTQGKEMKRAYALGWAGALIVVASFAAAMYQFLFSAKQLP